MLQPWIYQVHSVAVNFLIEHTTMQTSAHARLGIDYADKENLVHTID